jgi:hypothetical protein
MTFRVEEDEAQGLVRATMEGTFEKADVMAMVTAARAAATKRSWNILYDMRAAVPGHVGFADVFWMPRSLPALQETQARGVRVAVLHSGQMKELPDFWENSFRNVGLQARAFTGEAETLSWLRS